MRPPRVLTSAALLVLAACPSVPDLEQATLRCTDRHGAGRYIELFSFTSGGVVAPPDGPDPVDLAYYFDGDDCFGGALIGSDESSGRLYPVGVRPWSELETLRPPTARARGEVAIAPLGADAEGLAFWVRTVSGDWVLARIAAVQPATHADLAAGVQPELVLEWRRPAAGD